MNTSSTSLHFNLLSRVLHWLMAVMILSMLFIGVGMVASIAARPMLVDLHRPLGIAILLLVVVRLFNRLRHPPPPLPADLPGWQVFAAKASHLLLYALMFAMPLIGWSMLSAGGYPIVMFAGLQLPPIAPHDAGLYALLRGAHTWLAYLLYGTVLVHLGAALMHAWVRRDHVFPSMARGPGAVRSEAPVDPPST
ncbi:MAG: cytochrome b [Pseudoxanthomonas sp.]